MHSIGIALALSPQKFKTPKNVPIVIPYDRDYDEVPDTVDTCPDIPGLAALIGCPDGDGDGIADKDDSCVHVPGMYYTMVARYLIRTKMALMTQKTNALLCQVLPVTSDVPYLIPMGMEQMMKKISALPK